MGPRHLDLLGVMHPYRGVPPNNRLKLAARGRPVADGRMSTRAAA